MKRSTEVSIRKISQKSMIFRVTGETLDLSVTKYPLSISKNYFLQNMSEHHSFTIHTPETCSWMFPKCFRRFSGFPPKSEGTLTHYFFGFPERYLDTFFLDFSIDSYGIYSIRLSTKFHLASQEFGSFVWSSVTF